MSPPRSTEQLYKQLTDLFLARRNVTQEGEGFGSSALKVNGRIFAMLTPASRFIVKLPRRRVQELVESGEGLPFDAGKGRPMNEWVIIQPASSVEWTSIAEEALAFVGGHTAPRDASMRTSGRSALCCRAAVCCCA